MARTILVAVAAGALLGGGLPSAEAGPTDRAGHTVRPLDWTRTSDPVVLRPSTVVRDISCAPTGAVCVAVGDRFDESGAQVAVTQAWDGVEWRAESPPAGVTSGLQDVSCSTPTDCVALESPLGDRGLTRRVFVRSANGWRTVSFRVSRAASELTSVSCALPTWCLLTGARREVAVFGGDGVRLLPRTPEPVAAVSCASANWCAGFSTNAFLEWDGATWSATPRDPASTVHDLDCWGQERCLAVVVDSQGSTGAFARLPGSGWAPAATPPGRAYAGALGQTGGVDCDTAGTCGVLLQVGPPRRPGLSLATWTTGDWTSVPLPDLDGEPAALACGPGECVAPVVHLDARLNPTYASALHLTSGQWTHRAMVSPRGRLLDTWPHEASCPSRVWCLVLGMSGAIEPYVVHRDGDAWVELPAPLDDQRDLDCRAPGTCVVAGSHDTRPRAALLREGRWRPLPALSPPWMASGTFTGVSCAGARCAYTGLYRAKGKGAGSGIFVAQRRADAWRIVRLGPRLGPERRFTGRPSVDCPSRSRCVVVTSMRLPDQEKVETTFEAVLDHGRWSWASLGVDFSLFELDCTSSGHCVAAGRVDSSGLVMARDPRGAWRRLSVRGGETAFYSVSCTGRHTCRLASEQGRVQLLTRAGSRWTAQAAGPRHMTDIACSGPRSCLAFNSRRTWLGRR